MKKIKTIRLICIISGLTRWGFWRANRVTIARQKPHFLWSRIMDLFFDIVYQIEPWLTPEGAQVHPRPLYTDTVTYCLVWGRVLYRHRYATIKQLFCTVLVIRKSKKKDTHGFQIWRKFRIMSFLFRSFFLQKRVTNFFALKARARFSTFLGLCRKPS